MVLPQSINRWKYNFIFLVSLFFAATGLTGCAILFPHHDLTTQENLIRLKADAITLIELFDTKPFDRNEAAIADLAQKFQKAYVYEKRKGKRNSDTMRQFDGIWSLLSDDIAVYRDNGNALRGQKYFH